MPHSTRLWRLRPSRPGILGRLAQAKVVKLLFFRSPVALAAETQAQLADAVTLLEGL